MQKNLLSVLKLIFNFLRNIWGTIDQPYVSYRKIVKGDPYELLIIFGIIAGYFFLISPLKLHTFHPLLITFNASRLFTTTLFSFMLICFVLYLLAHVMGSKETFKNVLMGWGYSLIPTLIWFWVTSLAYVVLPPPRHPTLLGNLFSIVFVAFSISLFWWKGILYYLTLRLGLRLNLQRIIIISVIFLPSLFLYSIWLYRLGIFKVPFI